MKASKIIVACVFATMALLIGCTPNQNVPDESEVTKRDTIFIHDDADDDEVKYCEVFIYPQPTWNGLSNYAYNEKYFLFVHIHIKQANGKTVEYKCNTDNYWGKYKVPYDGTLEIEFLHHYIQLEDVMKSETFTLNVGSENSINVGIFENSYGDVSILIFIDDVFIREVDYDV